MRPVQHARRSALSIVGALLILGGLLPVAVPVLAVGSVSLTAIDAAYTQDFNTLAQTGIGNTALPTGWALNETGISSRNDGGYAASNGSENTGDTYSYGSTGSADRAFAMLRSGALDSVIGVSLTNDTGVTITSLDVSYTGEEWRLGVANRGQDRIDFEWSTDATGLRNGTWLDANSLDFSTPNTTAAVGAIDGNAASNRTPIASTVSGLSIATGTTFWIRFLDFDIALADDGLGVDDFSLTPHSALTPTDPTGVGAANPPIVAAGGSTLLTVAVTPGTNPTSTGLAVSADLSPIGGSPSQPFFDDATNGDAIAGDDVFSYQATVDPATSPGLKTIGATLSDAEGRSNSASISLTVQAPPQPPGSVVVSEVYGGGGNTGATLRNDFIELFNRTDGPIDLTGWSVQYASSLGPTWQVTTLGGSIPAHGYYLVQEAAGAGGTLNLPTPDAVGSIPMSATSGKVAIVFTSVPLGGACPTGPSISDFVGYGGANCFEGSGAAPTLSNTTSAQRHGDGSIDTDDNAADFSVGSPNPRGATEPGPQVIGTFPLSGGTDAATQGNVSVTFSEPVDVTGSWFTIGCATSGSHAASTSGGPTTFYLDPAVDFAANESCTVTIVASQVTDQDTDDPADAMSADFVFSFSTGNAEACGDPATAVHAVQGSGLQSPLAGTTVSLEGVVVGDYQESPSQFGGFHLQEEDADADADAATSEGIFVFFNGLPVQAGDLVRIRGRVTEFAIGAGGFLTELAPVSRVVVCSGGQTVTASHVVLPVGSLADWEAYESMLVTIDQPLAVTDTFTLGRFGEVALSLGHRLPNPTNVTSPGPAAIALEDLNDRSRILLDDGNNQQNIDPTHYPQGGLSFANTLRVGDTLPGLSGVLEQRFSVYRIQPVETAPVEFDHDNTRPTAPAPVDGNLRVAAFNVLNFFNGDGLGGGFPTPRGATTAAEFERQRIKIINAITAIDADVVGLMELENDAPPNSAIEDLVGGLNATVPGTYAFIDTGVVGTDQIRVGLIYKPAAVTPVGPYAIIDSSVDPRFIDTKNRPSIAQTFERNATGARITIVVNHLKSKGSPCDDVGDPDIGDGQGNCNQTRKAAAEALVDWLGTDPTGSGDPDVLLIGDMNSYAREDPIAVFEAGGFSNTIAQFVGDDAYSFVFDGESGYLDHALASSSLVSQVSGVTEWHINADEPVVLDYNVEFKTANQVNTFYSTEPYRASDHDPVLVGINLNASPTVDAGGPYAVVEGAAVTVAASGSDPDGDALTYAWDLDDDGTFETPGQTASFSAAALQAPLSLTIHVMVTDSGGLTATDDATVNVIWDFSNFFQPVDVLPTVNTVRAGSNVPVKFSLDGDQGTDIFAPGYPTSVAYVCDSTAPMDAIETVGSPGGSPLSYDAATDTYTFNWKTERPWAGTCRRLVVKLADGTFHYADFSFN